MMNEAVSSIMTSKVVTVTPEDTVQTAKKAMDTKRVHHMPVVDENNILKGLITTADLLKLNRTHDQYADIKVENVMTTRLAVLEPTAKVGTAAEIFMENLFHAIPIVNENTRELLGLVTTHDVLQYSYEKEYPPKG